MDVMIYDNYGVLAHEKQHDKDAREKNGLPLRKYNDITDYEVTYVETIYHHK